MQYIGIKDVNSNRIYGEGYCKDYYNSNRGNYVEEKSSTMKVMLYI